MTDSTRSTPSVMTVGDLLAFIDERNIDPSAELRLERLRDGYDAEIDTYPVTGMHARFHARHGAPDYLAFTED